MPKFGISFIERLDQMYDKIEPCKLEQNLEDKLSPLTVNIYKTLYDANSKVELLNKELLASMTAQANNDESVNVLPPDMLQKELVKYAARESAFKKFENLVNTVKECNQILDSESDPELVQLAKEELEEALEEILTAQDNVMDDLIPVNELDEKDCTLEIKQAAGGQESALFADDLKGMYEGYARLQGLQWNELMYHQDTGSRGCKYCQIEVKGMNAYQMFKHESGVHKVQRVPDTERQGRLHSSTAVVVIMPVIPSTFSIDQRDIKITTMKASGAGGQHVNTTDSAVRAVHIPTGITVVNKDERDQHKNKDKALSVLRERVYKHFAEKETNKIREQRQSQMGTGNLSEKIRTYNWPNNRITDHRTGSQKFGLDAMLSGQMLMEFTEELIEKEKTDLIDLILNKNDN